MHSLVIPTPALPPPPWAKSDSATLAPLPVAAADPPHRGRILAAILVALVAAVLGFFGVRVIADLAGQDAATAALSPAGEMPSPTATA